MISTRLKQSRRRETNYSYFPFLQIISNTGNLHGFVQNWRSVSAKISRNTNMLLELPFFFCIIWHKTLKFYDCGHGKILMSVLETYSPTKYFSNFLTWIYIAAFSDFYFGLLDASVRRRPYVISKNVSKMGDGRHISLVKDWTCLAKKFRQSGLSENYLGDDGVSALIFCKNRALKNFAINCSWLKCY